MRNHNTRHYFFSGAGKDEKQSRGVSDARAARQAGKVLLDNREEHRSNIRSLDVDAENDAKLLASPKDNKKGVCMYMHLSVYVHALCAS